MDAQKRRGVVMVVEGRKSVVCAIIECLDEQDNRFVRGVSLDSGLQNVVIVIWQTSWFDNTTLIRGLIRAQMSLFDPIPPPFNHYCNTQLFLYIIIWKLLWSM